MYDSRRNLDQSEPESLQPDEKEAREASFFTTYTTNKEQSTTLLQWLEYFSSWFRAKCVFVVSLLY